MKQQPQKPYDHFIHPYVFLLKEGHEITNNFLDYSLLLLQVGQADVLHSPHKKQQPLLPLIQIVKR